MSRTGGCGTRVSGEHLISEAVLKVIADKEIEVSGMPWLKGQKKTLGFGALTANCLCSRHNSLLSPIDIAGARFFEAIQKCGTNDCGRGLLFLISGHDVERWILRSLTIFGVSGNFAIDGTVIDRDFVDRLHIIELLESVANWKRPLGLYFTRSVGQQFMRADNLQIAPLLKAGSEELVGIALDIQGLHFALVAADHDLAGTRLTHALYRPAGFVFRIGAAINRVFLSWEDGLRHESVIMEWTQ
ncbi:hypothetical protein [Bradyrhizobium ivorense]|nr:hypothetical protein [Bradyrhizobium ivorense]